MGQVWYIYRYLPILIYPIKSTMDPMKNKLVLFTFGINVGKYTILVPWMGQRPWVFEEGNRYFTTCRDLSLTFQKHQPFEGKLLGGWADGGCKWLVTSISRPWSSAIWTGKM